jgi:hypothetical protein
MSQLAIRNSGPSTNLVGRGLESLAGAAGLGAALFGAVVIDAYLLPLEVAGHVGIKTGALPSSNTSPLFFLTKTALGNIKDAIQER